ncbi:ovochymase-1 [Nematolebias whitei]|uniref:ovochymase-1 n=1 Tax=Nematolebias whitei TaxID=451745 RepID=UPI001897C03E|nr:ovochymase-1 [Nematolebias whitei]
METRIIGGQEAWAHSWPWQVSLQLSSMPACGGAIIGPQWVISAAHCFKRYNKESLWKVLAGRHDLDKPQEPEEQLVKVSRIISHNGYDLKTKERDVALLKLERPLVFNEFVRPIDVWMSPLPDLLKCTITGWGSTRENGPRVNRLQEVNVTILSLDACNEYYKDKIRQSMFCAGKEEGGVDACQGDSGGPLSCFTGTRHELAGLVSWGVGCGRAKKPGVYTKVQEHVWWISEMMNSNVGLEEDFAEEGLAGISVSQGRGIQVDNVTESCPFSWPWMVSLQSNRKHYCSGVLIHHRWVVTAKHCSVSAKEDVAILGLHDMNEKSTQTILVEDVISPMHDASFPPQSDLSLLRLSVSAKLENMNPSKLHQAELALVNETDCHQKWGDFFTDAHICAHPAGSASCMGDSGAPLFCQRRDTYFLFGVVTWGSWRCNADKPSVFTRVPEYNSWIKDETDDQ